MRLAVDREGRQGGSQPAWCPRTRPTVPRDEAPASAAVNHGRVSPIRVVVADDDDLVRRAVCDLLVEDRRFEVVGDVPDGTALAALAAEATADLVVTDARMRDGGVEGVRRLKALAGPVVVVLSAHSRPSVVAGLLAAGADGFIDKAGLDGSLCDLLAGYVDQSPTPTVGV